MKYTKENIETWISELKQSGQSIAEFSKDKPFHPSTLHYWLSKESQHSKFLEVKPKREDNKNQQTSIIEIRYPNGVTMSIVKPLSITELLSLVRC